MIHIKAIPFSVIFKHTYLQDKTVMPRNEHLSNEHFIPDYKAPERAMALAVKDALIISGIPVVEQGGAIALR